MKKNESQLIFTVLILIVFLIIFLIFREKKVSEITSIPAQYSDNFISNQNDLIRGLGPVVADNEVLRKLDLEYGVNNKVNISKDKFLLRGDKRKLLSGLMITLLLLGLLMILSNLTIKSRRKRRKQKLSKAYLYKGKQNIKDGEISLSNENKKELKKTLGKPQVTGDAFSKREELIRNSVKITKDTSRLMHFNVPKEFEKYSQDSYEIDGLGFVISDGASTSIFSEVRSKLLCEFYLEFTKSGLNDFKKFILENLTKYSALWKKQIEGDNGEKLESLPYYARNKLKDGSHASLCGAIINKNELSYNIIGDSCIFHLSKVERTLVSIPVKESKEFGSYPDLLCTKSEYNKSQNVLENIYTGNLVLKKNDVVILVTDGIAEFLLNYYEKNGYKKFIKLIDKINGSKDIAMLLTKRKTEGYESLRLTDDDSTYIYYKHK